MKTSDLISYEVPVLPPAPRPLPPHWFEAWRALRSIMKDPDDTARAIEFFFAVGPGMFERNFQRFASSPSGRRLLIEGPCLASILSNRERLAVLPPDSFGRAYLLLMDEAELDPLGLIDLQQRIMQRWQDEFGAAELDPLRAWFRDRYILVHDLLHVLTGYGTDELGEAALLAFTYAQFGGRAWGFLTLGTAIQAVRAEGPRWLPYLYRAWGRGRIASWSAALPFEELLPLPLAAARHIMGIGEPEATHAAGALRGSWSKAA